MLIGRDKEKAVLQDALNKEESQFIAVYGRRRVGKTYLIRESYGYQFYFQFTGAARTNLKKQLARFALALEEQGLKDTPTQINSWMEAFSLLKRLIKQKDGGKKVIFLDELPWLDTPRSGFLSELEVFWNGWASARKDIVLIVCGSATSWMVNKIIKNKGGLHNRLTQRIALKPFTLKLCKDLTISNGVEFSQRQLLEAYMIFGGVPYYWSLLKKGSSLAQEIDRLIFSEDGDLYDEFSMLYASLFKKPEPYIKVISLLADKNYGMTRQELISAGGFDENGAFSDLLADLEWCGFVRSYQTVGKRTKDTVYQLVDNYTVFYYSFLKGGRRSKNFWQSMQGKPEYNTWCGLAFERVCLWHTEQIKTKLGINGIVTTENAWRNTANSNVPGAQIDLLIERGDGITNICEIKFSLKEYSITKEYMEKLLQKKFVYQTVTKTRKAVHLVMITTFGITKNAQYGEIQNEVTAEDLFK
ncbi:MAG: ATP-binding protein [Bacteroidales bacterium]|nr:ATP-binding protein [Bacteroidales bacterium]